MIKKYTLFYIALNYLKKIIVKYDCNGNYNYNNDDENKAYSTK